MPKRALYRIVWIGSLLAMIVMTVLFVAVPQAAPTASASLVSFTTSDKYISLRHPSNWTPKESTEHAVETDVVFMPNETTRCLIKTDMVTAMLAEMSKSPLDMSSMSGMSGMPGMPTGGHQKSTLEAVHEYQGRSMEEDFERYHHYKEEKTVKVRVAGTEALFTQFTYQKGVGFSTVDMIGRRISAITGDRRLAIVTNCRKDQAETLEPIFQKIIDSVQIGQGG